MSLINLSSCHVLSVLQTLVVTCDTNPHAGLSSQGQLYTLFDNHKNYLVIGMFSGVSCHQCGRCVLLISIAGMYYEQPRAVTVNATSSVSISICY